VDHGHVNDWAGPANLNSATNEWVQIKGEQIPEWKSGQMDKEEGN